MRAVAVVAFVVAYIGMGVGFYRTALATFDDMPELAELPEPGKQAAATVFGIIWPLLLVLGVALVLAERAQKRANR